jgi:hypothetical protein|tara:strand:+ start:55 stop:282 length:228 start_codon:yes stop_codon:yes gene_type:complete
MTTNNKDMNKFLTEMDRLDEQFTEDLVEEFVDDLRHGKNRNISFKEYRKQVIKSLSLKRRVEASGKINGGGEEDG